MVDLIYPTFAVPEIPSRKAESQNNYNDGEWLPIVDETAHVVGRSTRTYCHSGSLLLHPVVHLHLIDRMGRLYLQKRSLKKDIHPGKWDTAVGGHVAYGENILEALKRESYEELRLVKYHPTFIETYIYDSSVENEMVFVFATVGNFTPKPDLEEVIEGRFWEISDIESAIGDKILTPNFEMEFSQIKDKLLSLL